MSFVLVSFFVTADFYRKKNMNVKDTVKINFENSKKTFKSKYHHIYKKIQTKCPNDPITCGENQSVFFRD